MMDLYDQYDETLLDLAREAARQGWWMEYGVEKLGYQALETEASTKWESTLLHIPGLLQTEDYMRTLFSNNPGTSSGVSSRGGNGTGARLHRQRRLTDPDFPIEVVALINEAALRGNVGGDEVMCAQLQHLVRQAEPPNVTIQVLPNRDGTHHGMEGEFIVLSFPEDDDPDLLYVPYITGALHIDDPHEVAEARLTFEYLRSEALSPGESVAYIEKVIGELRTVGARE